MSCSAITSAAMTNGLDLFTFIDENGNRTIDMACNHEVVSNLIRVRLQYNINQDLWLLNPDLSSSLLQTQVKTVSSTTYGVSSVDMSGFSLSIQGDSLDYGTICPLIDCANSAECVVL